MRTGLRAFEIPRKLDRSMFRRKENFSSAIPSFFSFGSDLQLNLDHIPPKTRKMLKQTTFDSKKADEFDFAKLKATAARLIDLEVIVSL